MILCFVLGRHCLCLVLMVSSKRSVEQGEGWCLQQHLLVQPGLVQPAPLKTHSCEFRGRPGPGNCWKEKERAVSLQCSLAGCSPRLGPGPLQPAYCFFTVILQAGAQPPTLSHSISVSCGFQYTDTLHMSVLQPFPGFRFVVPRSQVLLQLG